MAIERIDKILSSQGICSRKECDRLVRSGCVMLNNEHVKSSAVKCDTDHDKLYVNGKCIKYYKNVYYVMNKPSGVLSATDDPNGQTVIDLLPDDIKSRPGLFPAGRLDKDTEGLLIITDDGIFAHRLMSPSCHIPKTYSVTVDADIPLVAVMQFRNGIYIDGGHFTLPANLEILSPRECKLTICEGKYHQVKLMMKKIGCTVTRLKRISIGGLCLSDDLDPGEIYVLPRERALALLEEAIEF